MTYAQHMIHADAAARCKKWDEAARHYTTALRILLFQATFPVTNTQVQTVQALRFECYRQSRARSV
jgi:hypothetical protein